MPSAASVLGFNKSDRDFLGGWSAEGSQRYTRIAKYKIAQMQTAVASTFRSSETDQLAEADDIDSLADFLRSWDVPEESIRKSQKILCLRSYADLERSEPSELVPVDCDLTPGELALDNLDEVAESQLQVVEKKNSNQATEIDPSFLDRITNKLVQNSGQSCRKAITYHIQARRLYEWYTVWAAVICCLESITCLSQTLVCSSRLLMSLTQYASGVRKLKNQRRIQGLREPTLRHLRTSEFLSWEFSELSTLLSKRPRLSEPQFSELKRTCARLSELQFRELKK